MYISKAKKYRDQGDGTAIAYDYYRLMKSYIDKDGKTKHRNYPRTAREKKIHATPKSDFKKSGYCKSESYITGGCNVG